MKPHNRLFLDQLVVSIDARLMEKVRDGQFDDKDAMILQGTRELLLLILESESKIEPPDPSI